MLPPLPVATAQARGDGKRSAPALLVREVSGALKAKVGSDGDVATATGTLLGFLNADGSAGDVYVL